MKIAVTAFPRTQQGTGASRRLRGGGRVPGVVYGAGKPAAPIELDHHALLRHLKMEAFHASIIDKRRPRPNVATVMNIIGEVRGRTCVIIDDLVDTANTLCEAAKALKGQGAERVLAYCTHPVLSGNAVERIANSALDEIVVTDTIPLREDAAACGRIRTLSIAGLLAETMLRISNEDSVSSLFVE